VSLNAALRKCSRQDWSYGEQTFMSDLLPGLIVLAIGGSIAPPLLLLSILFLGSRRTVGALLIVLGLRSLLNAPDPDASPPRWMESINSISAAKAVGYGMALFPVQIKNLAIFVACVNLIAAAGLSPRGSIVALMLVLVVFAIPVLALIGLYAAVPHRASTMLGSLQTWMEKNNRTITVVLCFVFGALFLVRGLSSP
jgi:hypothetical protein